MLSPVEEIKSKLDIVEVLSGYIKVSKAGANFRALCPFHHEKSPSFMISPARQIWHCFGCNEGGDIFKFVMKIEGVEFGDALRNLAHRAGVILKREDPQIRTERGLLMDVCRAAMEYFKKNLEQNKEVQEYLKKRGLKKETIEEFKIGYSTDAWDGLLKFLNAKNFKSQDIEKAGLAVKSEKSVNGYFDRFRDRVMFPIANSNGDIIGFGGRIFHDKENEAKYVNSPQTLIYDKSKVLYGFDKAKMEIRKDNFTILVEGYMDLIMSHQAGAKNTVAVSGTALTRDHLHILRRLSDNICTCFDMDNAGDKATKRAIDMALSEEFNVKVITVPSGKDPADFVLEYPDEWTGQVQKAQDFMDFYFDNIFSRYDKNSAEGKKNISRTLLSQIKKMRNKIEQSHWIGLLSQKIKVKPTLLEEEMARIAVDDFAPRNDAFNAKQDKKQKAKEELLGERIVACVLKDQSLKQCLDGLEIEPILGYNVGQLIKVLQKAEKDLLEEIKDQAGHLVDYANQLLLSIEALDEIESLEQEANFCVKELKMHIIRQRLNEISSKIQDAEDVQDDDMAVKLMQEFRSLSDQLNQYSNNN